MSILVMIVTQQNLSFFWKPAGIASTIWATKNILSMIENYQWSSTRETNFSSIPNFWWPFHWFIQDIYESFLSDKECITLQEFIVQQKNMWWYENEYGLVNRLDIVTAWWLFFAKNLETYQTWRPKGKQNFIKKRYVAYVEWNMYDMFRFLKQDPHLLYDQTTITLTRPIMHHKYVHNKMLVITDSITQKKWRWSLLETKTIIKPLDYDSADNLTLIDINIIAWKRHQIRAHCASLGYPICGDLLYWSKGSVYTTDSDIWLRSIWFDLL